MTVRRVLPSMERRMIGPFVFFDHMGPAQFPPGKGIAVRPHPHIGIATITYLFQGQIMHRDSLGYTQPIQQGAVNLMVAGNGIVHSERAGDDLDQSSVLHGIQSWIALPETQQETEPQFWHHPASSLPEQSVDGVTTRVIMGQLNDLRSPVKTYSPTLYLECVFQPGASFTLPPAAELALYVVEGKVKVDGMTCPAGVMAVVDPTQQAVVVADTNSRLMVIGGHSLGKRHIWWNFVSSSRERIEQAKADWAAGRFDSVPGDSEFIPLPD